MKGKRRYASSRPSSTSTLPVHENTKAVSEATHALSRGVAAAVKLWEPKTRSYTLFNIARAVYAPGKDFSTDLPVEIRRKSTSAKQKYIGSDIRRSGPTRYKVAIKTESIPGEATTSHGRCLLDVKALAHGRLKVLQRDGYDLSMTGIKDLTVQVVNALKLFKYATSDIELHAQSLVHLLVVDAEPITCLPTGVQPAAELFLTDIQEILEDCEL
ncbi:hypothetical protein EK21DRAFT_106066 [Setomelanomma holmii]|uniref:Uncharacterized protein n=1 Tax=Setomelanomma holmii TaxID=210430 RepID=A0A9P4HM44_9PLEO|nr:hypothetical protein EK21DRAFT_106066 [Setomelanomma holmii]